MAPQIMVQQMDQNNDPVEGPNGPVFLTDIDAVAQIIRTTLGLLLGEWWEDLSIGFPLFQSLIGSSAAPNNLTTTMLLIQQTIKAAAPPFVLGIATFTFQNGGTMRKSSFTASILTTFGTLTVTNAPGSSAILVNS